MGRAKSSGLKSLPQYAWLWLGNTRTRLDAVEATGRCERGAAKRVASRPRSSVRSTTYAADFTSSDFAMAACNFPTPRATCKTAKGSTTATSSESGIAMTAGSTESPP